MNANTNANDSIEFDRIAIARRLLQHALTDLEFRHRSTLEINDRLCELIVKLGLYGWEAVFEWPRGFEYLSEAIHHALVWLTTVELLDLSQHIPLTAQCCAPGRPWAVHDVVAIGDDAFRHEGSGGIETVSREAFLATFMDEGKPIWKLLSAPNPPAMAQPIWPTSPRSPAPRPPAHSCVTPFCLTFDALRGS